MADVDADVLKDWMHQKAKLNCNSLVQAFLDCAQDRTISLAWTCRPEHKAMKQCMEGFYRRANFTKYRQEYLRTVKSK
ncbi:hypothetical protein OS493_035113 [Desmophyllum pertusum]|uniref:COX assembly mitochondrial protein n=1 Tax=Desmophyllum pertusum TaxID=174260 RepID=A0A9W9Z6W7_9CNID|nr:hypothetical protein OS493_035113 [Desmophyllum pertusum]